MMTIDGSTGEGGGQVLRTSLALSMVCGKPFRMINIRAGRKKPGLMRQHLTAANAAARISCAEIEGNSVGSTELAFRPGSVRAGEYNFAVGTAGSCTLVFQTVLPALLQAEKSSTLVFEGGTHNPYAPPFDFLAEVFLPIVSSMGPEVSATLRAAGFYPAGGGKFAATVNPAKLQPIGIEPRGRITSRKAVAMVARLPENIANRELKVVKERLDWDRDCLAVKKIKRSRGPGNILFIKIAGENFAEVFTGFGQKGVSAERVAEKTVKLAEEFLASSKATAGKHLADQLLIPMAMAGEGSFHTISPTMHTKTNIEIIKKFLEVEIGTEQLSEHDYRIRIKS